MPPVYPPSLTSLGYGGEEHGYSPYGSGIAPRPPVSPDGGYGGQSYGINSYGSIDITAPRMSSAVSLDGFRIEVFFTEEMQVGSGLTDLFDPANYSITPIIGAPATVVSVTGGVPGTMGGFTSVIITHSGTTLGGQYTVTAINIVDMAGNPIDSQPTNFATLLTLGDAAEFTVTPTGGTTLLVDFWRPGTSGTVPQDMLTEAEFTPGIESLTSYGFASTYPVPLALQSVTHPFGGNLAEVEMEVQGMTTASYTLTIVPSEAVDYDGTYLPSAATTFLGVELGIGTSSAGLTGLYLTKSIANTYGWAWEDTSGKVLPSSSYRVDFTFAVPTAPFSIQPALTALPFGTLFVSDGAVQATVTLNRVGSLDVLDIASGAYSTSIPVTWSDGSLVTISVMRNQKSDSYTILVNGVPAIAAATASFTGVPTIAPGTVFVLGPNYEVTGFRITEMGFSSTQTVFTNTWNFLHNGTSVFIGSSASTRSSVLTDYGPLVKGWGDATPAEVPDVEVLVNGTAVAISAVNPYAGIIYPTIPIPLMPVGSMTVEVNYIWFANPAFALTGLNTEGLVLNKWDRARGHHYPPASPMPATALGVPDDARFMMGIVLPPLTRQHPILIGHRYIGFEKGYTAALNSPTTLLLNQDPHRVSVPYIERSPEGVSVAYEGTVAPTQAQLSWLLEGTDSGQVNVGGTYTLIDASAGTYEDGTAALYYREEDLSFDSTIILAGRLVVDETTYDTNDGVFTGICIGAHDNRRMYLAGCLLVNDVKHVGFLQDGKLPQLEESWEIGPRAAITILDATSFTAATADLPNIVGVGSRFQIFTGSQTGIYTIESLTAQSGGTTLVTIESTTPFPADPAWWGNRDADTFFEVLWDEALTTYRLVVAHTENQGIAQFYIGGTLAGLVFTVTDVQATPVDTALLLRTGDSGQVFWGSSSRPATNESTWSFFRYGVTPTQTTFSIRGLVVAAEMSDKPEDDPNHEWFITQDFGYSEIDSSGDTLLLKSTSESADSSIDLTFGYARIEPAIDRTTLVDVDAEFRVETGTVGSGDAWITVYDTEREIRLATLMYWQVGTANVLLDIESVSLSGLRTPTAAGWSTGTGNNLTASVQNQLLVVEQTAGQDGTWFVELPNSHFLLGKIIEARLAITSYTPGVGGNVGPIFGADVMDTFMSFRTVAAAFVDNGTPAVILTSDGTPLATFAFDWNDGEQHTYRLLADPIAGTVTLEVDDVVMGAALFTAFAVSATRNLSFMGAFGTAAASTVAWDNYSAQHYPPASAKRTLGVLVGDDPDNIDSWELPRGIPRPSPWVPNSDPAAVIYEMDWRSYIKVRIQIDPGWGVTILRPDLPLPPWYTGDFATETTEPSAGWITVDTRRLPRRSEPLGQVRWGSLDPRSVTQQRWRDVRYRVFTSPLEDYIQPQNMVLNQWNTISSGELGRDVTAEVVEVESITSQLVSIRSAHITADRVFNVVVDGTLVPSSGWSFDQSTQVLTLVNPLPSAHYPVQVTFAPGEPVTNTYLCSQPLLNSVTLLNEGTPPYPMSQMTATLRGVVFGSKINDPSDTLNNDPDFITNDPFRTVEFSDDPASLYEDLEFCTVDDDGDEGLLSSICDGPGPGMGLVEIGFSGGLYHDEFWVLGGPGGTFGSGSPVIGGTAASFSQTSILHASGGSYVDGILGPVLGAAILYPNFPSGAQIIPGTGMGGSVEVKWALRYTDPFADLWGFEAAVSDNTPPTYADPDREPNPDGTPGVQGHGACAATLEDYAATGTSRLGPWGGLTALSTNSLLAGGAELDGTEFVLNGGAALPPPTTTDFQIEAAN